MTSIMQAADDVDKTVKQLLEDFEATSARVSEYQGAPLVVVNSDVSGDMWFLLAEDRPAHAPGHWFECEGMMVTHVINPEELLCTCAEDSDPDAEFISYSLSCPVCS